MCSVGWAGSGGRARRGWAVLAVIAAALPCAAVGAAADRGPVASPTSGGLVADAVPPGPATKSTTTATDLTEASQFRPPVDPDYAGALVLRKTGAPVDAAPVAGTAYNVGNLLGPSLDNEVACIAPPLGAPDAISTCGDALGVAPGSVYYYEVFPFDTSLNYATGAPAGSMSAEPKDGLQFKWNVNAMAAALNAVGVLGDASSTLSIVAVGNYRMLHKIRPDGLRATDWDTPFLGGAVQSRPTVADFTPQASPTPRALLSAQNGHLYEFDVSGTNVVPIADRDVAGDAGCTYAALQGGAVVHFGYLHVPPAPPEFDRVLVATRCSNTKNKIMAYDLALTMPVDRYPDPRKGDTVTLNIANATPLIVYRDPNPDLGNDLLMVPVRARGLQPTLVTLELKSDGTFARPAWALDNFDDIDASPALVKRGPETFVAIGNLAGQVYILNPFVNQPGNHLAVWQQLGTPGHMPEVATDGAVKGLAVSTGMQDTSGLFFNWMVWTTDTIAHGIKLTPTGADPATYWEQRLGAPSVPLLLTGAAGDGPEFAAWVGNNDGMLYRLDASNATPPTAYPVKAGVTVGDATLDYSDGTAQGIIVGTTAGTIHWVRLGN